MRRLIPPPQGETIAPFKSHWSTCFILFVLSDFKFVLNQANCQLQVASHLSTDVGYQSFWLTLGKKGNEQTVKLFP